MMKRTAAQYLVLAVLLAASGMAADANRLAQRVRHQLAMVPYYSVFDNLTFGFFSRTCQAVLWQVRKCMI